MPRPKKKSTAKRQKQEYTDKYKRKAKRDFNLPNIRKWSDMIVKKVDKKGYNAPDIDPDKLAAAGNSMIELLRERPSGERLWAVEANKITTRIAAKYAMNEIGLTLKYDSEKIKQLSAIIEKSSENVILSYSDDDTHRQNPILYHEVIEILGEQKGRKFLETYIRNLKKIGTELKKPRPK
ncbi:MAG: hypothetical protein V1672_05195 [Candidatus Diapherotrites archaeon]